VRGNLKGTLEFSEALPEEIGGDDEQSPRYEGWKFLDVREPGEFEKGSIKGAVNVPLAKAFIDLNKKNQYFLRY